LNHAQPTIKDLYQTLRLGIFGFAVASLGISLSFLIGSIIKPVIETLLLRAITTTLFMWFLGEIIHLSAVSVYSFFENYWAIFLISYSSLYALNMINNTNSIGRKLYQMLRFMSLLFLCVIFAYVAEQTFEFTLNTWLLYSWFSKYILWSGKYLAVLAIILGIIYTVACFRDQMPLWAIVVHFILWFSQILLLASLAIPILGLLGIGLGEVYASVGANANENMFWEWTVKEGFALIGTYAGLILGAGYLLFKGLYGDLGWVTSKVRQFFMFLFINMTNIQERILLQRRWWQILLLCIISAILIYLVAFFKVA
jgi:hypothetical protein